MSFSLTVFQPLSLTIQNKKISARIKAIKKDPAAKEELAALKEYMSLLDAESNYKKAIKQADSVSRANMSRRLSNCFCCYMASDINFPYGAFY